MVTDPLLHFQHMPQYSDLAWPGMYVSQLGFNLPGGQPLGITPHSGSQCAVAIPKLAAALNPFQQNGNNNLLGLDLLNPIKQNILQNAFVTASANMTADYFFSPVKSFDLKSFWFACSLSSLEAVVSLPQACSMDVYGWKAGAPATGFPSAVATFVYFGNNFLKAGMTQATLPATFSGESLICCTKTAMLTV